MYFNISNIEYTRTTLLLLLVRNSECSIESEFRLVATINIQIIWAIWVTSAGMMIFCSFKPTIIVLCGKPEQQHQQMKKIIVIQLLLWPFKSHHLTCFALNQNYLNLGILSLTVIFCKFRV